MQQISIKKYKTRQDWVVKVVHWELCKKIIFDFTKCSMHNPEYVLENEMHRLFYDFKIQVDNFISARRPDRQQNKNRRKVNFADKVDH